MTDMTPIAHFTVTGVSEAGADLVLIQSFQSAFLHVAGKKRKEVCIKLGQPQPRSPLLKG